jgi:hypothetical protein
MQQFQVYADYGANYELVVRDIEDTQQQITTWSDFDRAIEILSATVNPVRTREENYRRALSVKDLLIKVSCHKERLKTRFTHAFASLFSDCQDTNSCSMICAS